MKKLILIGLMLTGCTKQMEVGKCYRVNGGFYHVIKNGKNIAEVINLKDKEIGMMLELDDEHLEVDCAIVHEVFESWKKK